MLSRTCTTAYAVKLGRLLQLIVCIMADEFPRTCMQYVVVCVISNKLLLAIGNW